MSADDLLLQLAQALSISKASVRHTAAVVTKAAKRLRHRAASWQRGKARQGVSAQFCRVKGVRAACRAAYGLWRPLCCRGFSMAWAHGASSRKAFHHFPERVAARLARLTSAMMSFLPKPGRQRLNHSFVSASRACCATRRKACAHFCGERKRPLGFPGLTVSRLRLDTAMTAEPPL